MDAHEAEEVHRILDDPHIPEPVRKRSASDLMHNFTRTHQSSAKTIFNAINAMVGSGTLVFPLYFVDCGFIVAIIALAIVCLVEFGTANLYITNYSHKEDDDIPPLIERTLGKKWKITFIITAVVESFTGTYAYFLIMSNIIYTFLKSSIFEHLPEKENELLPVGDRLYYYRFVALALAFVMYGLCSIRKIQYVLKINAFGVYILTTYMLFLFGLGVQSLIEGKVNFDQNPPPGVEKGIKLFTGDFIKILGIYAMAFNIHPFLIEIFKHNAIQKNNSRDLATSYVGGTILYTVFGIFGSFAIFWRSENCNGNGTAPETILDCFQTASPAIKVMLNIIEVLLLIQLMTVIPVCTYVTRSQLFSMFQSEFDPIDGWKFHSFNIAYGMGGLVLAFFDIHPSLAITVCGAVCAFIYLYWIPILIHIKQHSPQKVGLLANPALSTVQEEDPYGSQYSSDSTTYYNQYLENRQGKDPLVHLSMEGLNPHQPTLSLFSKVLWACVFLYGVFVMISTLVMICISPKDYT